MRIDKNRVVWTGIRGRNGADSPLALANDEVVEAINVDFVDGALCRKRRGALSLPVTSGPTTAAYASVVHLPSNSTELTSEIFALDSSTGLTRYRPSANVYGWVTPTIADAAGIAGSVPYLTGASLNGKCFLAYYSAGVNRLHCWDATSIRRVGLAPFAAAPTVANTGGGAYPATLRYYRTASAHISGVIHVRRSELSASVSFTPSGAGTHARVTRPTAVGEGETHWLVYASADDVYSNYHLIATVAIGTTTYDDNATVSAYTGDAPQIAGLNVPPPSARYVISDGNRLLLAGAYETSASSGQTEPRTSRVWYTRVLGSSAIGDDESIPNTSASGLTPAQKNYIDVGENDNAGAITALAILNGVIYVFKLRALYRLAPTGDDLAPYRSVLVSSVTGCSSHASVVQGEDAAGTPVLYFTNRRGVYRLTTSSGPEFISHPLDDYTLPGSLICSVYYPHRRQLWVNLADTGVIGTLGIYDVRKGGWTIHKYAGGVFYSGVIFQELDNVAGNIVPATTGVHKPVLFQGGGTGHMGDDAGSATDPGGNFQAYVQSRPYFPAGVGKRVFLHDAILIAAAASGVTVTATTTGDFGAPSQTTTATALLTAAGSETRVIKRVEESALGAVDAVQFTLGDGSAAANYWVLDALEVPFTVQESLS